MRAFENLGNPDDPGPFVFTCEHASRALPPGIEASAGDRELLDDHWGSDIGAAEVTRALVSLLGGQAVLGGFSRLVIDLNRAPDDPTLILERAGDQQVELNAGLTDAERHRRIETLFIPFHRAVDEMTAGRAAHDRPFHLISIHSFTPVWFGQPRPFEIGVLFDEHEREAVMVAGALAERGFASALNQPYSGKPPDGLIYSAKNHANRAGVKYIELEIRQDLIADAGAAAEVAARIAPALNVLADPRASR